MLVNAGCAKIIMGIETTSERLAEMYNRARLHSAVPRALALIESYRSRMPTPPSYQFIIDNPYETLNETLGTLRFAVALPRPWDNPIYSLMLFPGTPLYDRAKQDGLISDEATQIYGRDWHDQSKPFFRVGIRLYRANFPPLVLRLLLWPLVVRLLTGRLADLVWKMWPFRCLWARS